MVDREALVDCTNASRRAAAEGTRCSQYGQFQQKRSGAEEGLRQFASEVFRAWSCASSLGVSSVQQNGHFLVNCCSPTIEEILRSLATHLKRGWWIQQGEAGIIRKQMKYR